MAYYAVYKNKIKGNIKKLRQAFTAKNLDFQIFYSVKTNFCEPVLAIVNEFGCNFEILSDMEWERVKVFNPSAIVLNGPGKGNDLVKDILNKVDLLYFNIDNDTDFEILKKIDSNSLDKLKIGLRVYLNADGVWNRFGYNISDKNLWKIIKKVDLIKKLSGFHFHFSTNNFKTSNYQLLLSKIKNFLDKSEINIEFLDIGGGLPAANEFVYEFETYQKLPTLISDLFPKIKIISEAGRNIVADAVNLETKVISLKKTGENKFQVNIDTNIMHFQCFFEKKFWVEYKPKNKRKKQPTEIEICGNSCMQIDKISNSMIIEQSPEIGDEVIIHNIGAYSYSQAANFISAIPEVKIYE
jgi:diaminopimelate decarboxylase